MSYTLFYSDLYANCKGQWDFTITLAPYSDTVPGDESDLRAEPSSMSVSLVWPLR